MFSKIALLESLYFLIGKGAKIFNMSCYTISSFFHNKKKKFYIIGYVTINDKVVIFILKFKMVTKK